MAGNTGDLTVAIFPWGSTIEDWSEPLGVSPAEFCQEMTGCWIFDYARALQQAGVRPVLVSFSARTDVPRRYCHGPTGTTAWLIPAGAAFRTAQRRMLRGSLRLPAGPRQVLRAALRHLAPYLNTPLTATRRVLRVEQCDAILVQEYEDPRFDLCLALGKAMRLPVFATFQGGVTQNSRFERPIRPVTIRKADGLVIAAEAERTRVDDRYGVRGERVAAILNPVDLEFWQPGSRAEARQRLGLADEPEIVVTHGRVDFADKGLDVLLSGWATVCSQRPGRRLLLVIVGDGPDSRVLLDRIAAHRLPVRFEPRFLHDEAEVRTHLQAADVFAFAGRFEGFPVAVAEAMACGLPVVATNASGIADAFPAGEASGGLVVPIDDAAALASAIGGLLDDEPRRRRVGINARARAEAACDMGVIGRQLRDFIVARSAMRATRRPAPAISADAPGSRRRA